MWFQEGCLLFVCLFTCLCCPPGHEHAGEEIPTLSARIEEKQKSRGEAARSQLPCWSYIHNTTIFKYIWQGLSIRENICPDASRKIWRFAGFTKYFFKNTMRKLRSRAFQRCITLYSQKWTVWPWEAIFCKKTVWKIAFWGDTNLDQVTLSSHNSCSKPPNLENYHIFGILRTSAFRWAIGKPAGVNIVRTAGRYFAQGRATRKIAKKYIFCFFRFSSKILWRKILPG